MVYEFWTWKNGDYEPNYLYVDTGEKAYSDYLRNWETVERVAMEVDGAAFRAILEIMENSEYKYKRVLDDDNVMEEV